jgi:predicted PurR-regulated permease PerM
MDKPQTSNASGLWQGREPLLAGAALLLLMGGCFLVLKPFMSALIWAMVLSYTLFPLQKMFTRWFRGARTLAACVVALTVAVVCAGPIVLIGMSLAEDGKALANAAREWFMEAPEEAPGWVSGVPVVGDELAGYWENFAEDRNRWMNLIDQEVKANRAASAAGDSLDGAPPPDFESGVSDGDSAPDTAVVDGMAGEAGALEDHAESPKLIVLAAKFLGWAREWLLSAAKAVGNAVAQVLLSAFIAFFILREGPELARRLSIAVERLAGERGERLIKVAGDTVRGVIFGILVTALAQAVVAGIGFWIAGVPAVVLLSVLTFFFAVIPYGPPVIWVPAGIWLYSEGNVGMSVFMFIWGAGLISTVDNFLRPYLISQGSKTPFILIFCGVIGGALAFGLVGIFLGPILLAIGYRLIREWTTSSDSKLGDSLEENSDSNAACEI